MTRIAYRDPEEMTDEARELTIARGNLNVYRTLANAEKVFTGWMQAGQALLASPVLPLRLRELVVLRTAYLMDCPYELGQHRDVARTAGVGTDEINAITSESDWQTGPFDATELAVLQLTSDPAETRWPHILIAGISLSRFQSWSRRADRHEISSATAQMPINTMIACHSRVSMPPRISCRRPLTP